MRKWEAMSSHPGTEARPFAPYSVSFPLMSRPSRQLAIDWQHPQDMQIL